MHAHINVLFVSPDPARYLAAFPETASTAGMTIASIEAGQRMAATNGKAAIEAWCSASGVSLQSASDELNATYATWSEEIGDLATVVALTGRVNDLVVISKPDMAQPFSGLVFDAAVFSSGRPALMVPDPLINDHLLRHVTIAWNGSLEIARLIGQSTTLLHEAKRVTVIKAHGRSHEETTLADLSAYLRWHGIVADTRSVAAVDSESIGAAILQEAERIEATLLVMGAYTHSRIREFLLGGVTRHIIAHTRIPVLMGH